MSSKHQSPIAPSDLWVVVPARGIADGKSRLAATLAPELAPAPGAIMLRSDVERKAMQGSGEDERLPPQAYTRESAARVYAMLVEKAGRVIAAGRTSG